MASWMIRKERNHHDIYCYFLPEVWRGLVQVSLRKLAWKFGTWHWIGLRVAKSMLQAVELLDTFWFQTLWISTGMLQHIFRILTSQEICCQRPIPSREFLNQKGMQVGAATAGDLYHPNPTYYHDLPNISSTIFDPFGNAQHLNGTPIVLSCPCGLVDLSWHTHVFRSFAYPFSLSLTCSGAT